MSIVYVFLIMSEWISVFICLALVVLWIKPLGGYMAAVYLGLPHPLARFIEPLERFIYRFCGIKSTQSMNSLQYSGSVFIFSISGFFISFIILIFQDILPLNPENMPGISAHLAFNIAASFLTNSNWQSYSGEAQLSYFSQTVALGIQMFCSAATGLAVAVALCRALAVKQSEYIGNFWVDMLRGILYILLPLALVFGLILVSQGVIQNYSPYVNITTLEGVSGKIAQGPVALHGAIKILGSNGGGFFAAGAAHPYENPNAISSLLQMAAMLLLPCSFVYTAGLLMRDRRQAYMMLAAMFIIFLPALAFVAIQEFNVSPKFDPAVIDIREGNMEGKETRFGVVGSSLWSLTATATSNGATNSAHDSFAPLSGLIHLLLMQVGEVVFGGVGSGLYGMIIFVLMSVFISGLMVGRTPEFLGKKLSPFDVRMISIAIILPALLTLGFAADATMREAGRIAVSNPGAHGFSQILYAFTSAANNNGSALAGLQASSEYYNIALGICMLAGRYGLIFVVLTIAGSFASKNVTPPSAGTLPTHSLLFTMVLVATIIILGVLTYIPALALGPIAEHLTIMSK